jgi:surfactin synthase thioesterase subunit
MHELDDAELLDRLARLGGIPQGVLADPDLMAWQLPLLRADLAVNENYRCPPGPPLPVPITAFGGARDPKVTEAELGGWAAQSSVGARTHLLPGGHFFVQESMNELLRLVMSELVDPPDSAPTTIRSVAR